MAIEVRLVGPAGHVAGRAPARFCGAALLGGERRASDLRSPNATTGTIAEDNLVLVKATPESAALPIRGARVRLHRAADGLCAWQGVSDAAGYYHATGLEVGVTYIPVAIDLSGTYECVASGPVVAVLPA